MAILLDGKALAKTLGEKLKEEVLHLERKPKLVIIQVGSVEASNTYIKRKIIFGAEVGIEVEHTQYPETVTQDEIAEYIRVLNIDKTVDGVIVQLPLPPGLNKDVLEVITPTKDVDGLTKTTLATPATTRGILALLDHYKVALEGKKAVVVGRSALVGIPTAKALLGRNATVTICHSHTVDLAKETRVADVLVVATGKPGLITKDHVREGQVVIDVGGDVDFAAVEPVVEAITPARGGVGPMTIVSLFQNVLEAARKNIDI